MIDPHREDAPLEVTRVDRGEVDISAGRVDQLIAGHEYVPSRIISPMPLRTRAAVSALIPVMTSSGWWQSAENPIV